MNDKVKLTIWVLITSPWCLAWDGSGFARDDATACIELNALAYDDWTSMDGGGNGLWK